MSMDTISKKEADRWDRVLDAAAELADLIESSEIEIGEYDLEELTIFLASNAAVVRQIFRSLKRTRSSHPPASHGDDNHG